MKTKTINVLGHNVKVVYRKLDKNTCGTADFVKNTIFINNTIPYDTQVHTFYHELIHIILEYMGQRDWIKENKEDILCDTLGFGLSQVLTDNLDLPKLKK